MSQERIEAAAKALCVTDYEINFGRKVEDPEALWDGYVEDEREEIRRSVADSLAAADAVMFSDEAIERAAKTTHDLGTSGSQTWEERDEAVRELYREDVRIVVAALKGDA